MTTSVASPQRLRLLIDRTGVLNPGGGKTLIERREDGRIVLRGELGRADTVTSNNRLYPRSVLEREVKRLQSEAKAKRLYGELDHPADGRTQFQRVSHLIREIHMEEDGRVIGELELIQTQKGKDLIAIIESGGAVGVSSRGTGTTHKREDGVDVVNEDYTMITYDIVADPAHSGAYPEVFFESKDVKDLGRVIMPDEITKQDDIEAIVQSRVKESLEKYRAQIRAEEQERLKEQFQQNLLSQVEEIKKEALERARSEILSDPAIADAKRRLEAIQSIVGKVEESDVIKKMQEKIVALQAENDQLKNKLEEVISEKDKIASLARKTAVERYVEKVARSTSDPDLFRELIKGKVSEQDSAESLKQKVSEAISTMKKFEEKNAKKAEESKSLAARIREEVQQEMSYLKKKIESLENENKKLIEQREQYRAVAERGMQVGRKAYIDALKTELVEAKTAGHPARIKIRNLVEQANLNSREEIEAFIDNALKNESKNSAFYESVRSKVQKGEGAVLSEEGVEKKTPLRELTESEQKLFGTPLSVMRRLAGIGK